MPKKVEGKITFNDVMKDYSPCSNHRGGQALKITEDLSKFVNNACSINGLDNIKNGLNSCLTKKQLVKIANAFNSKYPKNKITFNSKTSRAVLWKKIQQKMEKQCGDTEWCWLDQSFIKNGSVKEDLESQFKPRGPDSLNGWLSTTHISDAMGMYELLHNHFKFFGPVPIDFDAIVTEIKRLNLEKLYYSKNIKKIGIIFNLDPHYKNGSHWVAMYCDISKAHVYYFDSYGICPAPKEIIELKDRLFEELKTIFPNKKPVYKCNTFRHQYANSDCGVYSMYFILQLLHGKTYEQVTENIILDEEIKKMREVYFLPKN